MKCLTEGNGEVRDCDAKENDQSIYFKINGECCGENEKFQDDDCCSTFNVCRQSNNADDLTECEALAAGLGSEDFYYKIDGQCCEAHLTHQDGACCDDRPSCDVVNNVEYASECEKIEIGANPMDIEVGACVCHCPASVEVGAPLDYEIRNLTTHGYEDPAFKEDSLTIGHPDVIENICSTISSPVCVTATQTTYESECRAIADGLIEQDYNIGVCKTDSNCNRKLCVVKTTTDSSGKRIQDVSVPVHPTDECLVDDYIKNNADLNDDN